MKAWYLIILVIFVLICTQNVDDVFGQVDPEELQNKVHDIETRFNDLKSQVDGLKTNDLITVITAVIGAVTGIGSLIWSGYSYIQSRKGYLKIKLQCSLEKSGTNHYIVSKTGIENTSTKRIRLRHALILIVDESITTRTTAITALKALVNKPDMRTEEIFDLYMMQDLLNRSNNQLVGAGYCLESIPYYYNDNRRVGSLESLSFTHSYQIPTHGTYAVLFCAVGEDFFEKSDDGLFRSAHDKLVC